MVFKCSESLDVQPEISVLVAGIDGAGKTSMLNRLRGLSTKHIEPTCGHTETLVPFNNFVVKFIEVGGHSNVRTFAHNYLAEVHAIVFVIDAASNYTKLLEAREYLHELASEPFAAKKPLLVIGNKKDDKEALCEYRIRDLLDLYELEKTIRHSVFVERISCKRFTGTRTKSMKKKFARLLGYVAMEYREITEKVNSDSFHRLCTLEASDSGDTLLSVKTGAREQSEATRKEIEKIWKTEVEQRKPVELPPPEGTIGSGNKVAPSLESPINTITIDTTTIDATNNKLRLKYYSTLINAVVDVPRVQG